MQVIVIVLLTLIVNSESRICICDQCIKNGKVYVNSTFGEIEASLGEHEIVVIPDETLAMHLLMERIE